MKLFLICFIGVFVLTLIFVYALCNVSSMADRYLDAIEREYSDEEKKSAIVENIGE